MRNSQNKGISSIQIIIVVVILLTFSLLVIYIYNTNDGDPVVEVDSRDEILGWDTYTSPTMKITFSYPSTWFLSSETEHRVGVVSTNPNRGGNLAGLQVQVQTYPREFSESTFWSQLEKEYLNYGHGVVSENKNNLQKVEIGSISAYTGSSDAATENILEHYYFLYKENRIYKITVTEDLGFPERNVRDISDKIISSFRFL